jgi:hypothetical protein
MASSSTKKTWIAIAIAAVVILIVLALALVGGSAYVIAHHVHAQFVSSEHADEQLAQMRARFAGQTPLIEITDGRNPIVHRTADGAHGGQIQTLRAMIYSEESRKLVTVNLPMWLLRMMPADNRFSFVDADWNLDSSRTHITLEDIDRHGPGLILDGQSRDGDRVLIWAE